MVSSNLHLVDDQGRPLPKHIVDVVERLEPTISRQFSSLCDPAQLSNSIEERARKIAAREKIKGPLADVASLEKFTLRSLWNSAVSLVRYRRHETFLSEEQLRTFTGVQDQDAIIARIHGEEILSQLSERDREICDLESQGVRDADIAAHLSITRAAVRQARHRRKEKIVALGLGR